MLFFLFGTFFFMINIAVSISIVPVYLISQHATLAQVGISSTIYSLSAITLRIFLGPLADKKGRKFSLLISAVSFILSWILIWLAPSFSIHIIARIIQSIGVALYMSTGSSVVSDVAEPKILGTCMGLYRGFLGLGFVLGPVIAFKLIEISFSAMFLGNIAFATISLLLLLFIKETGLISNEKIVKKTNYFSNYLELLRNHNLLRYYLLVVTITSGFGILSTNSAIYLSGLEGVISPSLFLFSLASVGMIASFLGGRLVDKIGIKRVIIPAVMLALAGFLAMALIGNVGNIAILFVIISVGFGTNSTVISSITGIERGTRKDLMATSFSIQESAYDGGFAIGNFIFGFLVIALGYSYSFLIIGILMGLSYLTIFLSDLVFSKNSVDNY
ncbi:MAG: major facilitator superfamily protein [Fusobacteria bacterium]|nr:MAG: major facilitator superfamily protein [Fusobacteriota bacterium]KAF0227915.1 MAG: major facilitator superfamily [Fusobacteriota bacterium]